MGVRKISVSLPEDLAEHINAAAERAGLSLSSWIARSVAHSMRVEEGLAAVALWEREHGAFTMEELTGAAAELAELDAQMFGDHGRERLAG